ncbi:transporter [Alphaproteobacteria bacterium]|nr:transporter [Alphaproteobacteria bacterium]
MSELEGIIISISRMIWGIPLIAALLGIGIYFSFKLRFLQVSHLKLAIKYVISGDKHSDKYVGDISNFASLCTALSATIGTGNIVGVALAITTGGPGALFWIWISAFFCMALKYAEGVLAIKYRTVGSDGKISGGPMYYIEMGLGNKFFAKWFALGGVGVALVGIGTMTQTNTIASAANSFGIPSILTAALVGIAVAVITIGGIHRIAYVSEKIVPLMCVFYVGAAISVLIMKARDIPDAISSIFIGAFSPEAIFGGSVGVTVMMAIQLGICRGVFSHESGLGSAAIASAAAKVDSPVKQGLISMVGAFFSIIVCTMTGLVLIITNVETGIFTSQCAIDGTLLTSYAFGLGLGTVELGKYIVGIGILFFAFTTIIGWNYYGEKCIQYLWGTKAIAPYRVIFLFFVLIGPFFKIDIIFIVADIVTGLMTIPNLIGLVGLRKVIVEETSSFFRDIR